MKNEIQKLIKWAEVRQKAYSAMTKVMNTDRVKYKAEGRLAECAFFIRELKLLLNEQPEAITGGSHFCKHDVGGSTANSESATKGNDGSDTPSETQAVGGNKQTKEVCSHPEDDIIDLFRKRFCNRCKQFV